MGGNIESEFWGFAGNSPDSPESEPYMKWLTQISKTSDEDADMHLRSGCEFLAYQIWVANGREVTDT